MPFPVGVLLELSEAEGGEVAQPGSGPSVLLLSGDKWLPGCPQAYA